MTPYIILAGLTVLYFASRRPDAIGAIEEDLEHLGQDLVDMFVREPVARDNPALKRTQMLNFPDISVTRTGYNPPDAAAHPDAPFYYLNAEAHLLPGGGIALSHGPMPAHTIAEISQDYMPPHKRW